MELNRSIERDPREFKTRLNRLRYLVDKSTRKVGSSIYKKEFLPQVGEKRTLARRVNQETEWSPVNLKHKLPSTKESIFKVKPK